jgi:hypothetical protein
MDKKNDKFAEQDNWLNWIGKTVEKHSGKPFKSGAKSGVIVSVETNPNSNKQGFKMDDGSIVDCFQCKLQSK